MAISDTENQWLENLFNNVSEANLSQWQQGFYADQYARWKEYGSDTRLSPKQWNSLFGIADREGIELPDGRTYEKPNWA